jgi:hypothetical protein
MVPEMLRRLPLVVWSHRAFVSLSRLTGAILMFHEVQEDPDDELADLPGQALLQIADFDLELDIPYHSWFDEYAPTDLEPRQMVYWLTNAPHRVENRNCLNISLTVNSFTDSIRRAQIVSFANGLLRHRFGRRPRSRNIQGPSSWAKAVLQKGLRNGSWTRQARLARRAVEFRLDRAAPGGRRSYLIAAPCWGVNMRGRLR